MDLKISIENNKFITNLYDKRDYFPFCIVRMPYIDSNIPSKIFYSSFGAEILRYARNTSKVEVFLNTCKNLLVRMLKQGGHINGLSNVLNKIVGRHFDTFSKFYEDPHSLKEQILQHNDTVE